MASALIHPRGSRGLGVGHNALGAWWWLAEAGLLRLAGPRTVFQQELGERVLPVEVLAEKGNEGEPWRPTAIGMRQTAPSFGAIHNDPAALADALALEAVDLATGSAAGPLACYLAKYGRIAFFATVLIEQGYVQERPSRIEVRLHADEVRVFGAGVTVAEGVLRL